MTALQPCGTRAAYVRHKKAGETPCDPCTEANRAASRATSANTRARHRPNTKENTTPKPVTRKRDLTASTWEWGPTPTTHPTLAKQAAQTVTRHVPAHDVPKVLAALGIEELS